VSALKAYEVRDDGEGCCVIQFATNSAAARREGASELNTDWECIESCVRKPEFDAYAPGPVPPLVLIAAGWWFECLHCGRLASKDMAQDMEDDGLDPADFVLREAGKYGVFCSATCEAEHLAEERLKAAAVNALLEVFRAKFPEAEVVGAHVCGTRLQAREAQGGMLASVSFAFPGGKYPATFEYGSDEVWVSSIDRERFIAWRAGHQATVTANFPCGSLGEEVTP